MTLIELVRRFGALPSHERSLAVRALCVVVWLRLWLTVSSFATVDRMTRVPEARRLPRHPAARIGSTVAAVSTYVPGATCLTQALATRVLLSSEGYSSALRLGMSRVEGRLQAHAWVESGGQVVVGGAGHEQFAPFKSVAPTRLG